MSSRTVSLTLDARVGGLVTGLRTAQRATADFSRDLGAWRTRNEKHLDTLGGAAGKAGLAITAGLGLVGKAAMDWQSDWTGVLKTVDGTPEQLGKVEDGLRGLAKTLPSSHREIAGVAEAAGQLGVATGDVVDFTKVMIDLGESTNMSAETAATQLARFSNIMGTSTDDVGRLGATLVGLGNNFATTESEIMDMSMRLAGAGKQIGLSEGQTMGLAAAMSSVGIEAEAGGSAMSMTMKKVSKAVDEGGKSLDTFASVSGMTAEQFATLWKKDAAAGLEAFTLGLGEVGASGESVNAVLTELGITGIRESDALLRLSSAGELMGNSMRQGSQEFADGSALIEEATKRYETAESKVKMAWNGIKDAAITAGSVMLPVIANIADGVSGLADWFGSIPAPIQAFITILGGVTGAGLLAIAGLITVSKKVNELSTAFAAIAPAGGRAAGAIAGVGKALSGAVIVGAALAAGKSIIEGINDAARAGKPDLEAYFNLLATGGGKGLAEGLKFDESAVGSRKFADLSKEVGTAHRALEQLLDLNNQSKVERWGDVNLSFSNARVIIDEALELEKAMKGLARAFDMGEAAKGQDVFAEFAEQIGYADEQVAQLINTVPELKSALTELATQEGIKIDPDNELALVDLALGRIAVSGDGAADALTKAGEAGQNASGGTDAASVSIRGVAMSAEDAEKAVEDFYDALVAVGAIALSERDALRGLEESFDTAAEAAKKNGKNLDTTTEKGRANEAALDGIASATLRAVEAQEQQGRSAGDLAATMEAGREAYIKQATAMGMPKKAAEELANQLNLIPDAVFMQFETNAEGVTARVEELYDWVKAAPDGKIEVHENTPEVRVALEKLGLVVKELPDGTIQVSEKGADATGKKIDGVASKKREAKIDAKAITDAAEYALNQAARDRTSRVTQTVNTNYTSTGTRDAEGANYGNTRRASGGSVFGPGTETSDSIPALLSNSEHVWTAKEVRGAGGHANVETLRDLARRGELPAFAKGGRVGAAEKKVKSTRRAYDLIDGKRANRLRKLAAKDQWEAAKAELAAVKKSSKASETARKKAEAARKKAAEEERARRERVGDLRYDLNRDIRRGNITDGFTNGNGLSTVDRLFDLSRNKDLSKSARNTAGKFARSAESALKGLTRQAESLEKQAEKAKKTVEDLLAVKDNVSGGLRGEFSLSGTLDRLKSVEGSGPLNAGAFVKSAQGKAAQIMRFNGLLDKLRKKGFTAAVVEEVAMLGSVEGTQVGNALLGATSNEKNALNSAYKSMDYWSGQAGLTVTKSLHKTGLEGAEGFALGIEQKQKRVEDAMYKLGKGAEKALRKSLDTHSPSRKLRAVGHDGGEGLALGFEDQLGLVSAAAGRMGDAAMSGYGSPAFSVPPSPEVARYAAQPAQPVVMVDIDYDRLAESMAKVQIPVRIGNKDIAQANTAGRKELRLPL